MTPAQIEVLVTVPFDEPLIDQLKEISPRVKVIAQPARRVEEIPNEVWNRIEVLYTDRVLPDPALVPALRWLQFHFAGIDFAVESPLLNNRNIVVTTLSGAAAPQMAEYAVMMMLTLGHRMYDLFNSQNRAEWPHDRWERFGPLELRGSTVGIIGYGSIGREIARLLQPFGTTILATKRDVRHPQDAGYTPEGLGDPEGDYFTRLYPIQALKSMIKECDFVVVCVPLTVETRNLISEAELAVMKPTAHIINIGRGGVVDQAALFTALQERHLAGVAMDVFAEEPLPPGSPFWRMPTVVVTPHIGGISAAYQNRAINLFAENLRRYLEGVTLLNRFDIMKGY
ncbi:MAG: D-2-hydroxyacid dehydrogenase [Anaerolineaceae bacterium]|jgi:phosphoglycerate dehydrogenase-like enzyme